MSDPQKPADIKAYLKNLYQKYIEMDNDVGAHKAKIKELQRGKSLIQDEIQRVMKNCNIDTLASNTDKLKMTNSKTIKPLTKDYISQIVTENIRDKDVANRVLKGLINRPKDSKTVIRRTTMKNTDKTLMVNG